MKLVLVYKAQDILIRQAVHNRLEENGIEVFGTDTSINVVYPNTPNLYLGGVSAVFEGYRVLVAEENALRARALIAELEQELIKMDQDLPLKIEEKEELLNSAASSNLSSARDSGVSTLSSSVADYFRRFQLFTLISLVIPVLPIPVAIYYFYKLLLSKQPFPRIRTFVLWMFLFLSMGLGFFFLYRNLF